MTPTPRASDRPESATPKLAEGSDDEAVLEVALADLATYAGEDSPVAFQGVVSTPLLVASEPADGPIPQDNVLEKLKEKAWKSLPRSEEARLVEAVGSLATRATRHADVNAFESKNPRVKMVKPGSEQKPKYWFLVPRPIRIWPPGYSVDGRIAMVRMSIPWSMHHADGTFLLTSRQGTWHVLVRQFVFYV